MSAIPATRIKLITITTLLFSRSTGTEFWAEGTRDGVVAFAEDCLALERLDRKGRG